MIFGMHGLDAAIEHFGEAGDLADVADGNARFAQQSGGAAGGDQLGAQCGQALGKLGHTGLVGDADVELSWNPSEYQ